ncbi:MAG: helix-turn-helix domain-containing protein [Clostridia bacterium]|nr:helix-turn-helix domain-containing protein [Clostridia bacterium]
MTYDVNKELFGARLLELMKENGDTIYSVADYLKQSPTSISHYINGKFKAKATTIDALAVRYGVNPLFLMGMEGQAKELSIAFPEQFSKTVPVYGYVAAGLPILAEENLLEYAHTDKRDKIDFAIRVKGDSMINARIYEGDIVFIEKGDVENGQIGVVQIGDEYTLKRVYRSRRSLELRSENPNYPPMIFSSADKQVSIIGRVKKVQFDVR